MKYIFTVDIPFFVCWMYGESDHNVYKTIRDVKNAIRKHIDGTQECEPTIIGVAEYLSTGEWVLKEI